VQDPTLNTISTVGDDGRVALPLLGKVEVAGMTPSQVEAQLKALLEAKYITRADVSVQVVEYGNRPISVVGAVTHPGRINATANITLIQALTQAGGLGNGYGKALYVLRTGRNGLTEQISIDIEDLMVNGNPDLNLPLAPNDVVNVPMDTPIVVYVLGEVMRPGPVQFRRSQTPTLLQALASAGGPTDRASKTVNIKRLVNGKDTSISVNFRRIAKGNNADVPLQDNDTVFLGESVF
jgi:polysaccharide export outer membrane protein